MIEHYRRWFVYEQDAHAKTLDSLSAVPEERRHSEEFRKAVYLLSHIVAARRMWLFRFGVLKENTELFPDEPSLANLPAQLSEMHRLWSLYLSEMDDKELARIFDYQSYEGSRFRNTVDEILTQLFGHSWYHRGQIAMLVRSLGSEPAVTDFVFWAREPVE